MLNREGKAHSVPRLHCFALHFLHSVCVSQMENAVSPPPHHPEPTVSFRFTPYIPETKRNDLNPSTTTPFSRGGICSFIHRNAQKSF
jgi:hypothetical protein